MSWSSMEQALYLIGQALGLVALVLGFLSFQCKDQRRLLLVQTVMCLVFASHYLLIGAMTGMAMNAICVLRNGLYYLRFEKGRSWALAAAFAVTLGAISAVTWDGWFSSFMLLCMVTCCFTMNLRTAKAVRYWSFFTCPLAFTYDVFVHSYSGMLFETVMVISAIIGTLRNRKFDQKSEKNA